jgi:CheY-like chemotaxis protein
MQVFYCDDDAEDVQLFIRAIKKIDSSIVCKTACDGSEALEMLAAQDVRPDAIFVDLHMPKLDGLECVIAIRRNKFLKKIPLIVLSNAIERKHIEQFNKLGVYYFLSKCVADEELQSALKAILFCLPGHKCDDKMPLTASGIR